MKEERLKVLSMLEAGKIDAKAAEELLYALAKTADLESKARTKLHKMLEDEHTGEAFSEKMSQFSESMEAFAKDVNTKASDIFRDIEPKMRTAAKAVIEKTAALADEVSKNLNESLRKMEEERQAHVLHNHTDDNEPHEN